MTRDEIRKLVSGYATGTLTEGEQRLLFEAALDDQDLFDELARDQELKELLDQPGAKQRLITALETPKRIAWWTRPWTWAATGIAITTLMLIFLTGPDPDDHPPAEIASNTKPASNASPGSNAPAVSNAPQKVQAPPVASQGASQTAGKASREDRKDMPSAIGGASADSSLQKRSDQEIEKSLRSTRRDASSNQPAEAGGALSSSLRQAAPAVPQSALTPASSQPAEFAASQAGPQAAARPEAAVPPQAAKAPPSAPPTLVPSTSETVQVTAAANAVEPSPAANAAERSAAPRAGGSPAIASSQTASAQQAQVRALAPAAARVQGLTAAKVKAKAPGKFAFDYAVRGSRLEIKPAADGYLQVTAQDPTGAKAIFPMGAPGLAQGGSTVGVDIPRNATELQIIFSTRPLDQPPAKRTSSEQLDATGSSKPDAGTSAAPVSVLDGPSGTVADPNPSANSRLMIRVRVRPQQ